jgi:small basic protein (TIGR04137 family)
LPYKKKIKGGKMSVHPSFKSGKSKQQKSVLKRLERLLHLQKEDKWEEEKDSIFGLPKVKVVKMKLKKDKKEAEGEEAAAETQAAEGAAPAEGQSADAKTAAEPKQDKKGQ